MVYVSHEYQLVVTLFCHCPLDTLDMSEPEAPLGSCSTPCKLPLGISLGCQPLALKAELNLKD